MQKSVLAGKVSSRPTLKKEEDRVYKQVEAAGDNLHDKYILAGCAASHVGNVRKNNEDN